MIADIHVTLKAQLHWMDWFESVIPIDLQFVDDKPVRRFRQPYLSYDVPLDLPGLVPGSVVALKFKTVDELCVLSIDTDLQAVFDGGEWLPVARMIERPSRWGRYEFQNIIYTLITPQRGDTPWQNP